MLKTSRSLHSFIGCGNGAFGIAASMRFPNSQVLAVDPLESAVKECQKRVSQATLMNLLVKQAPSENLPFKDSCIERLLMRNVIHHLVNVDIALKEASRVLSPSGLMVIEAPCNIGDGVLGKLISEIYWLMDNSHRRTYHHPELISSILPKSDVEGPRVLTGG
ncbi:MAG: class I SAM-dependent methyltransferase [Okeania sp. SIO2C9]|uniref:class I SAM-dependent methyltransferase n=1 Tax=Okeania sp. SIO2C9 TaxID=2607791 RepID=UPI0013C1A7E5|nr:class I SAM-dependent methyltransferase [Okeania sp. SIO2C9]NEQ74526.1 class I SAM-dependent methyltransferase [Okeania sp. SIO2C9]